MNIDDDDDNNNEMNITREEINEMLTLHPNEQKRNGSKRLLPQVSHI